MDDEATIRIVAISVFSALAAVAIVVFGLGVMRGNITTTGVNDPNTDGEGVHNGLHQSVR